MARDIFEEAYKVSSGSIEEIKDMNMTELYGYFILEGFDEQEAWDLTDLEMERRES